MERGREEIVFFEMFEGGKSKRGLLVVRGVKRALPDRKGPQWV
jgi:hypothetical protein